ncbi:MAG: hypothetical protein FJW40_03130 [Acidobacteria bacterium]|nr:hypothetical protein [Acidobacteriota bacterium]
MHQEIRHDLELFLAGSLPAERKATFSLHLETCEECFSEMEMMIEHSRMLRTLRCEEALEPAPGFYARVMNRIDDSRRPSPWAVFADVFGRRMVYASMALVVLAGGVLLSLESEPRMEALFVPAMMTPTEDTALDVNFDVQQQREAVLVNLVSYGE